MLGYFRYRCRSAHLQSALFSSRYPAANEIFLLQDLCMELLAKLERIYLQVIVDYDAAHHSPHTPDSPIALNSALFSGSFVGQSSASRLACMHAILIRLSVYLDICHTCKFDLCISCDCRADRWNEKERTKERLLQSVRTRRLGVYKSYRN